MNRPWLLPTVIFFACWSLTTHGKYSASGDEPHYLMVSQSLWADHDLDVGNNYRNNDGRLFGASGLEIGLHARAGRDGRLLPAHDIGMPVVLTPVYVAANLIARLPTESILSRVRMTRGLFAYAIVSVVIIGLYLVAAVVTRGALATVLTPQGAAVVILSMWLTMPMLSNSSLIFPEAFALLATALTVYVAQVKPQRRFLSCLFWLAAVLGCLPWFHRKFVVYAAALLIAILWQRRTEISQLARNVRWLTLVVFAAPQVLLALWTWHYWGNLGGALTIDCVPLSWETFRAGSIGLLVDRENGLLVWAPVYALLGAGWGLAGRREIVWAVPALTLFALSASHDHWWGGFSPAARFIVPLIPIFAIVGARAIRCRPFRMICLLFLIPQVFMAADGWQHTRSLWPQGDGHNRVLADLVGLVGLDERIVPSIRTSISTAAGAASISVIAMLNVLAWLLTRSLTKSGELFEKRRDADEAEAEDNQPGRQQTSG